MNVRTLRHLALLAACALPVIGHAQSDSTFASLAALMTHVLPTSGGGRFYLIDRDAAVRLLTLRDRRSDAAGLRRADARGTRFVHVVPTATHRNPFGPDTTLLVPDRWTQASDSTWVLSVNEVARNWKGAEESSLCQLPIRKTAAGRWALDSIAHQRGHYVCFAF